MVFPIKYWPYKRAMQHLVFYKVYSYSDYHIISLISEEKFTSDTHWTHFTHSPDDDAEEHFGTRSAATIRKSFTAAPIPRGRGNPLKPQPPNFGLGNAIILDLASKHYTLEISRHLATLSLAHSTHIVDALLYLGSTLHFRPFLST